jgi:hypothetical protein
MSGKHRQHFSIHAPADCNKVGYTYYHVAKSAASGSTEHQISVVEAIAYTLLIAFLAILALGWFDPMIPWRD